jgi:hypothetical protein
MVNLRRQYNDCLARQIAYWYLLSLSTLELHQSYKKYIYLEDVYSQVDVSMREAMSREAWHLQGRFG